MESDQRKELLESDQRKELRSLVTQQPHGKLHLLIGDQCIDIYKVRDLSQTGMKLTVGKQVSVNEDILVRFQTKTIVLKINATVMWTSGFATSSVVADDPDSYLIGIRLTSRSLLHSLW